MTKNNKKSKYWVKLEIMGRNRTLPVESENYMRLSNCRFLCTLKNEDDEHAAGMAYYNVYENLETKAIFAVRVWQ